MSAEFWGIEVGSWAEWVSGLGTVGAVVFAARQFMHSTFAAERAQADLQIVGFKLEYFEPDGSSPFLAEAIVTLKNRSNLPIYPWAIFIESVHRSRFKSLRSKIFLAVKLERFSPALAKTLWDPKAEEFVTLRGFSVFEVGGKRISTHIDSTSELPAGETISATCFVNDGSGLMASAMFTDARNQEWTSTFGKIKSKRTRGTPRPATSDKPMSPE